MGRIRSIFTQASLQTVARSTFWHGDSGGAVLLFRGQPLHTGLDLGGQQGDGLQQVLLRQAANIALQEVVHMPRVSGKVDDLFSNLVRISHIVGTGRLCLSQVRVLVGDDPRGRLSVQLGQRRESVGARHQ